MQIGDGDLTFIRNKRTGCVHVVAPLTPVDDDEATEAAVALQRQRRDAGLPAEPPDQWATAMLESFARPTPVVCGKTLPGTSNIAMSLGARQYEFVFEFADEDFCVACIRGLGNQSHRAFEHPLPGQGDGP